MRNLFLVLFLSFCISYAAPKDVVADRNNVQIGIFKGSFHYTQTKDAELAVNEWVSRYQKFDEDELNVSLYLLNDWQEAIEMYSLGQLNFFALNVVHYVNSRKEIDSLTNSYLTPLYDEDIYLTYAILVNKKSKIKGIRDLKNKRVAMHSGFLSGKIYLDYKLLKSKSPISDDTLELFYTKKHSRAILKTYFGQADACIVPIDKIDLVKEFNPNIMENLEILDISEKIFMSDIAVYSKKSAKDDPGFLDNVFKYMNTDLSRRILNVMKVKAVTKIKKEDFEPFIEYYTNYKKLLDEYEKAKK